MRPAAPARGPAGAISAGGRVQKGMTAAGYSGTPLAQKLGIAEGLRVFVWDGPREYRDLVAPLPARVRQYTERPPLMSNTAPVENEFSSVASHVTSEASSSISRKRPRGIFDSMNLWNSGVI